jgi:ABC-type Mn2+/Zn2+ transport system ATPase subunit
MAYVPQREMVDWDFPVTVRDVVMMGRFPRAGWLRRTGRRDREIVDAMLERVGMLEHAGDQIGQLSGGQQQRAFIARALAQESDVLLLDEPLNGIDAGTQEVILQVIEEQRLAGKIVLLATHDLVSASCACDCLCCVNERMVSYGPVEETYTAENLSKTYGGPVIMLGRADVAEALHTHHLGEHGHHHHTHENLGSEHE